MYRLEQSKLCRNLLSWWKGRLILTASTEIDVFQYNTHCKKKHSQRNSLFLFQKANSSWCSLLRVSIEPQIQYSRPDAKKLWCWRRLTSNGGLLTRIYFWWRKTVYICVCVVGYVGLCVYACVCLCARVYLCVCVKGNIFFALVKVSWSSRTFCSTIGFSCSVFRWWVEPFEPYFGDDHSLVSLGTNILLILIRN